jgi:peptide deformylase
LRDLIAVSVSGAVGAALLVAGCGSGSQDATDAQQIDKATFVKQADAICEQASGRMAAELRSVGQSESAASFTATQIRILRKVFVPGLEEEQREIQALGMPKEAKKEAEALLEAYRKAIAQMKAKAKAIVESKTEPQEAVTLAARRIGIARCPVAPVASS